MKSSEWIFKGCPKSVVFRDEIITDESGDITEQKVQKRNVYQFTREKVYCDLSGNTIFVSEGALGAKTNGAQIYAYTGDLRIQAVQFLIGKWICVAEDVDPIENMSGYRVTQIWEKQTEWENYDL